MPRSSAIVPVGPRSWTARLRPANAPAATALSSAAEGSLAAGARRAGASDLASRIDGQRFGVLSSVVIRSGLRPVAAGGTRTAAAAPGPALAGAAGE